MRQDISEAVRSRIAELHDARRFDLVAVADRLGIEPSAVSKNVRIAGRALKLEFVAAVAEEAGVPLGELVSHPGTGWKELRPDELELLRYVRAWPTSVLQLLNALLSYFADEAPGEKRLRDFHEHVRRMTREEQEQVMSVASWIRQGKLAPDLLAGLRQRLEVARQAEEALHGRRRRNANDATTP